MCNVALSKLSALLLHPDARVLKAASEAIVFLMKYSVGQSFLGMFVPSGYRILSLLKHFCYNITR